MVVSFDVQGTLTNSAFSDCFWMEELPRLRSECYGESFGDSKEALREEFEKIGVWDWRYYDARFWINKFAPEKTLLEVLTQMSVIPELNPTALARLCDYQTSNDPPRLIALSSTTREFLEMELGGLRDRFEMVISTLDDFGIAGKPERVYREVRQLLGSPEDLLHIGDDPLMDVREAEASGWRAELWRH